MKNAILLAKIAGVAVGTIGAIFGMMWGGLYLLDQMVQLGKVMIFG